MSTTGPSYSLLEICQHVQDLLRNTYVDSYWIRAEINTLNLYPASGHCYPDLVEKKEGVVVAQMRSILWKGDYERINAQFQKTLKEPLKNGIKVLMLCQLQFHPVYGMSLVIKDMDPAYSLGDLEREKQLCIQTLKAEGLFGANRTLPKPWLPKRIALISDASSKGFGDFTKVLEEARQTWGYGFYCHLFPVVLQGDRAVTTILEQLSRIERVHEHFDAVALVRGGGGEVGMSCYNHLELNRALASFPLPLLTGIGHAANQTVAEQVAWYNAITPTKLAEWLVQQLHNVSVPLQKCLDALIQQGLDTLIDARMELRQAERLLGASARNRQDRNRARWQQAVQQVGSAVRYLNRHEQAKLQRNREQLRLATQVQGKGQKLELERKAAGIASMAKQSLQTQLLALEFMEKQVQHLSPEQVLKRGFSIVSQQGKVLNQSSMVQLSSPLTIQFYRGKVIANPIEINQSDEQV